MVQLLQKRLLHMECNSNRLAAITMFPGEAFGRVKKYFIRYLTHGRSQSSRALG